jgi:hypothetical protein
MSSSASTSATGEPDWSRDLSVVSARRSSAALNDDFVDISNFPAVCGQSVLRPALPSKPAVEPRHHVIEAALTISIAIWSADHIYMYVISVYIAMAVCSAFPNQGDIALHVSKANTMGGTNRIAGPVDTGASWRWSILPGLP